MKSRKIQDHALVIERIKNLSEAIQNPTEEGLHILLETCSFIQREISHPTFTQAKTFPEIQEEYLKKMAKCGEFDVKKFFQSVESCTDPRKTAKDLSVTNDPFGLIQKMSKAKLLNKDELSDTDKEAWMKIYSADIKHRMDLVRKELKDFSGKLLKAGKNSLRYIGVVVIVIGTLLMNYIICLVGLGLLGVDITLDRIMKEAIDPSDEVLSDTKNFPYVLSGSFPLVHVNRTEDYIDMRMADNQAFYANNLLELLKAIVRYEAWALPKEKDYTNWNDQFPFKELMEHTTKDVVLGMTPESVFCFKSVILDISNQCLDHTFKMEEEKRASWCRTFMNIIKSFCTSMNDNGTTYFVDMGSLVSMFEVLCLQIWDAFLRDNDVVTKQKVENRYLHIDVTDDSHAIQQMYNMQQLHPTRTQTNATQLAGKILESVGSSLTEATINNTQSIDKDIQNISAKFTRAMNTSKQAADQIAQRALPWCANNAQKLKDAANNFTAQDSATIKDYTYNVKNLQTANDFLQKIKGYLTVDYPKNRSSNPVGNINEIIKQTFPSLQVSDTPYPPNQVANVLMTGSPEKDPKEITVNGQALRDKYNQMLDALTNQATKQYFASNIFSEMTNVAKNYQTTINNAAKQPTQPKQESVLFEAGETQAPPTMNNQGSQTTQQNQQNNQPKEPNTQKTTTSNTNNANDARVFEHAANVTVAVMTAVQSMVNEAYNLVIQYYTDLINRDQQNTPQQTNQ